MAEVLVVDDDANNRLLISTLLRHAGHTPIEACDGASAIALAREKHPRLIIVDLSLPDMPGTAVITTLRSDSRTANALIAVYTATQLGSGAEELKDIYGISAVIPKPADPREILQLFADLLH